jgi:hypothetical protein
MSVDIVSCALESSSDGIGLVQPDRSNPVVSPEGRFRSESLTKWRAARHILQLGTMPCRTFERARAAPTANRFVFSCAGNLRADYCVITRIQQERHSSTRAILGCEKHRRNRTSSKQACPYGAPRPSLFAFVSIRRMSASASAGIRLFKKRSTG